MIYDGSKTVTTAGTRVALTSSRTACTFAIIQALNSNTDAVYVGGSTIASGRGVRLLAGDSVTLPYLGAPTSHDLQNVYVDAAVNGEGVSFLYSKV